jgi:hypothetical protein
MDKSVKRAGLELREQRIDYSCRHHWWSIGVAATFQIINVFGALPSHHTDNTADFDPGRSPRFGTGTTATRGAGSIIIEGSLITCTLHCSPTLRVMARIAS